MRSANYEVGFAFRSFRDGLEADPLLSVVIELVLDDSQQPLIEFEEGLYLHLMLRVEFLLLLDVFQVVLDLPLDHRVLALQGLHRDSQCFWIGKQLY